jgi:8-oxo-dGTP diphosphatase
MTTPQFGQPEPGRGYPDRPAAFVVAARGDQVATVLVTFDGGTRLDLPGGGVDPGESAADAAVRECGEEAGLKVAADAEPFAAADHYFADPAGRCVNTRGLFFAVRLLAEAPALKTEDDHELLWMSPQAALLKLDRESHAWAMALWLRRFAQGPVTG